MTPSAPIHYLSVLNVESLTFKKYRLHYTVLSYGLYNEGVEEKKRRIFRYIEEDKQGNAGEYYVRTGQAGHYSVLYGYLPIGT